MLVKKELLFKAKIFEENNIITYYFVEKEQEDYYFKFGISKIGLPIESCDDNRLSIVCKTKEQYDDFKNTVYDEYETYVGKSKKSANRKQDFYFEFTQSDNANHTTIIKQYDSDDSFVIFDIILKNHFQNAVDTLLLSSGIEGLRKYIKIDSFNIGQQEHQVIHDLNYRSTYYNNEPTEEESNEMKNDFLLYCTYHEPLGGSPSTMKVHKYYDLVSEFMNITNNHKYPDNMIAVDGWTVKELNGVMKLGLLQSYECLSILRDNRKEGRMKLYNLFGHKYPHLFMKEKIDSEAEIHRKLNGWMSKGSANTLSAKDIMQASSSRFNQMKQKQLGLDDSLDSIDKYTDFLSKYTVSSIENELSEYIIGQPNLIKHAAMYLYYHVLRQVETDLPPRPLLISGPSGSGKTEVWRTIRKLYSDYIDIEIIDGSTITQEGWSGNRKLSSYLMSTQDGAILIIDEFDKLATPNHSSHGDNVAQRIQYEFLKILEGEYYTKDLKSKNKKEPLDIISLLSDDNSEKDVDVKTLGIVLVGAFEGIRENKENVNNIGFLKNVVDTYEHLVDITDEDLIDFGVVPELVGRLSDRCTTNKLTPEDYVNIIKNKHSKVTILSDKLYELGLCVDDIINDDMISKLASSSEVEKLGVRWVSTQIENKLLEILANADIRKRFRNEPEEAYEEGFFF